MAKFDFEKFAKAYCILVAEKEEIEGKMKKLKDKIGEQVLLVEDRKVSNKYATMVWKKASNRESVDLTRMKKKDPTLYNSLKDAGWIKVTEVKETFELRTKAIIVEKK